MAKQIRSERLRNKLLQVCDGEWNRLQHALFHLNNLVEAEAVADWLISRRLTGKRLADWIAEEFQGTFLPMYDQIRSQVCRQNQGRPVLVGKDYLG